MTKGRKALTLEQYNQHLTNLLNYCNDAQREYLNVSLLNEQPGPSQSSPRHWAAVHKPSNVPFYGVDTNQSSESINNLVNGHESAREQTIPLAINVAAKVDWDQRVQHLKLYRSRHNHNDDLGPKLTSKNDRFLLTTDLRDFSFQYDAARGIATVQRNHDPSQIPHDICIRTFRCSLRCIELEGRPCPEQVAYCKKHGVQTINLYPELFHVKNCLLAAEAACFDENLKVRIPTTASLACTRTPIIPPNVRPPKGGAGRPKRKRHLRDRASDRAAAAKRQRRLEREAEENGTAPPDNTIVPRGHTCTVCGEPDHHSSTCKVPVDSFGNVMSVQEQDDVLERGFLILEVPKSGTDFLPASLDSYETMRENSRFSTLPFHQVRALAHEHHFLAQVDGVEDIQDNDSVAGNGHDGDDGSDQPDNGDVPPDDGDDPRDDADDGGEDGDELHGYIGVLDISFRKRKKQVKVEWNGNHRPTWEPIETMISDMPDAIAKYAIDNEIVQTLVEYMNKHHLWSDSIAKALNDASGETAGGSSASNKGDDDDDESCEDLDDKIHCIERIKVSIGDTISFHGGMENGRREYSLKVLNVKVIGWFKDGDVTLPKCEGNVQPKRNCVFTKAGEVDSDGALIVRDVSGFHFGADDDDSCAEPGNIETVNATVEGEALPTASHGNIESVDESVQPSAPTLPTWSIDISTDHASTLNVPTEQAQHSSNVPEVGNDLVVGGSRSNCAGPATHRRSTAASLDDNERRRSGSSVGSSSSSSDDGEFYTLGRPPGTEKLMAGDRIMYYSPTGVYGRKSDLVLTTVTAIDPSNESTPVVLDNGDVLHATGEDFFMTAVTRVGSDNKPLKEAKPRFICSFELVGSVVADAGDAITPAKALAKVGARKAAEIQTSVKEGVEAAAALAGVPVLEDFAHDLTGSRREATKRKTRSDGRADDENPNRRKRK